VVPNGPAPFGLGLETNLLLGCHVPAGVRAVALFTPATPVMKLQHSRMRSPGQPGHTLQTLDLARVRQAGE